VNRGSQTHARALVIDLGGVIVDFDRTRTYRALGHVTGLPFAQVQQRIEGTDLRDRYERGLLTDEAFSDELVSLFPEAAAGLKDLLPEIWGDIFRPNYDMFEALRYLKGLGVVLVLLSNTSAMHFNYVKKDYPEVIALFDRIVLSYEARKLKPDRVLYEDVIAWLTREHGVPTGGMLYVDDVREYVRQSQLLGMTGHVYVSHPHFIFWLRTLGLYVP